ncbi:Fic family protein (plasmid) [Prescottella equi]|uniref:protein adenylyltransferase n=1 Tax=Rhodococcus hoagii TaxID=43767 RepID=A0A1Z1UWC6_RHOHA|nr:Fic family protein [Prescottella equi]ARX59029.1 putative cell filamentation protein [Prescottella equi]ARX59079.1 putative cell filamentation protein [Prescottella equi]ARX59161.1 putative cell filamentation protein [Prescottella equi]ARX59256.1 putative cell filamentation protein [Prescottella equi]ARX59312.1 putative cell filamentation protein [Prescottella equi]
MSKPRGFSQEWVDYFIPETVSYDPQTGWPNLDDAVMRNLIAVDLGFEHGLPDQTIVDRLEVASSIKRLHELERNPIPGNYDLAHMQRIHHHLFQDVYPWAGEIRTAPRDWPMTKLGPNVKAHLAGEPNPPEVPHSYFAAKEIVPIAGRELDRIAAKDNLRGLDRDQFVDELTTVWARVNYVHPFREGNTRTQFAFFRQLAAEAGYELDTERFRDAVSAPGADNAVTGDLRTKFIWGRFQFQQTGETTLLREALDEGIRPTPEADAGEDLPVGPIIERGYDVSALSAAAAGHPRSTGAMLTGYNEAAHVAGHPAPADVELAHGHTADSGYER